MEEWPMKPVYAEALGPYLDEGERRIQNDYE
jgi:hypothetical protein